MSLPRLLVVTAVPAERDAVLRGIPSGIMDDVRCPSRLDHPRSEGGAVRVVAGGVGQAAAAAATARALAEADAAAEPYRLVLSAGIAGGFADRVGVGGCVLATRSVAADLGAGSTEGFLPLHRLGLGPSTMECDAEFLAALRSVLPDALVGDVLTVATITGTAQRARQLCKLWPDAVAEAMEGFGVATAADQAGVRFAELRTVSNPVGPRDRDAWRTGEALDSLAAAAAAAAAALASAAA